MIEIIFAVFSIWALVVIVGWVVMKLSLFGIWLGQAWDNLVKDWYHG